MVILYKSFALKCLEYNYLSVLRILLSRIFGPVKYQLIFRICIDEF